MSLFAFYCLLRSRWHGLASALWPDSFTEQVQAELALLDGELQRRHDRLIKYCQKTEKLRNALQGCERRTDARTVEKLEHRRQTLDRLRQRLREREQKYQELLTRFDHWKQERKAVREQLLSLPPQGRLRIEEEENDFGYPF
jgi:hypothetical protein